MGMAKRMSTAGKSRRIPSGNSMSFSGNAKALATDIRKANDKNLRAAASLLKKELKRKVSSKTRSRPGQPPGMKSGNLREGIVSQKDGDSTQLVGFIAPAHHAHLLEFGTVDRFQKDGSKLGRVKARPFFVPTILEQSDNIREILSRI
jgi:HK97 gp10 family phage protein